MKLIHTVYKRGKLGGDTSGVRNVWTLRVIHIDDQNTRTGRTWQYATKQDAKDDIEKRKAELLSLVEVKGLDLGEVETFRQWADFAKANFYKPAIIKNGRKVDGVKSHRQTHVLINHLVECFGNKPLAKFSKYDLDHYKSWRLAKGDLRGELGKLEPKERKPVTISTVNRGLAILKHLLIEAHDAGLIAKNITKGSKAIDADAETARSRTLTDAEEMHLLASCSGERTIKYKRKGKDVRAKIKADNPHLKAAILLGLDSGLRRGEILMLNWEDIDFQAGIIKILGTHTKTQRTRSVPMTDRTKAELSALPNFGIGGKVFPFNDFKRSWATAVKVANIDSLNFRDLRRTFVTRLQSGGVSIGIAAELAGHSRLETTQKHYTSTDNEAIIQQAAATINAANDERAMNWPDVID